MKKKFILISFVFSLPFFLQAQSSHSLEVKGLGFSLDAKPFFYTGVTFFNAIYNPTFNENDASRKKWLNKLKDRGINVIRVWAQWDNKRGFIDTCPTCTLYENDGRLRADYLHTLKKIIQAALLPEHTV